MQDKVYAEYSNGILIIYIQCYGKDQENRFFA